MYILFATVAQYRDHLDMSPLQMLWPARVQLLVPLTYCLPCLSAPRLCNILLTSCKTSKFHPRNVQIHSHSPDSYCSVQIPPSLRDLYRTFAAEAPRCLTLLALCGQTAL